MMETQNISEISIKKFTGRIPFKGELLQTLKNEEFVLVHRNKNEAHIMKKSRYEHILEEAKTRKGYTDVAIKRTREGNYFMRKISACVCGISVQKNYLSLEGGYTITKRLSGKDLLIKIFS